MAVNNANLALDGGDPRLHHDEVGVGAYTRRQDRKLHDRSVTFDEYYHYAKLTRAEQETGVSGDHALTPFRNTSEKSSQEMSPENHARVTDGEWIMASRAIRTATWLAVFYLITTDILGPYGVP
jgi:hypothetical protein